MAREAKYEELIGLWREASLVGSMAATLEWEQQTTLPAKGAEYRAKQLAYLAGLHHDLATRPRIGELLTELESSPDESDSESVAAVNVREIRWGYDRSTKLPKELVEALARHARWHSRSGGRRVRSETLLAFRRGWRR